jgi:hypothetical protein
VSALREAAQQALEALENIADEVFSPYNDPIGTAILALRAALGQPEQEPVLWRYRFKDDPDGWILAGHDPTTVHSNIVAEPLYTHPPRREWRGLTEEEISDIFEAEPRYHYPPIGATDREFARAIEAKLKERNA